MWYFEAADLQDSSLNCFHTLWHLKEEEAAVPASFHSSLLLFSLTHHRSQRDEAWRQNLKNWASTQSKAPLRHLNRRGDGGQCEDREQAWGGAGPASTMMMMLDDAGR